MCYNSFIMATKSKTKSRSLKSVSSPVMETPVMEGVKRNNPKFITYLVIVILLGVALFLLAKKYRGLVIAGMVNTTPVTRMELEKALVDRYGKATLDDLIAQKLLQQLAKQNQVTVTKEDIQTETKALEDKLGGKEALQASMERFGIDQAKLDEEISSVILQKKLSAKLFNVNVTDAEVTKYYNDNKALFDKKTFDEVKDDIKKTLIDQKLQEQFSSWFADQQKKAKIQIFI